jgi:GGDEF domain-containing protein
MTLEGLLGRALMDPATGLPNMPYFNLVLDWEERRAQRRNYAVRVLNVKAMGGDDHIRRSLVFKLCQEIRTSDLIASDGRDRYRVLLTSPDAEHVEALCSRVEQIGVALADSANDPDRLRIEVTVEPLREVVKQRSPCDPCDESTLAES